jgi:hypothetical protein
MQQPNMETIQPTNEEDEERTESDELRVQSGTEPSATGENTSRRDHEQQQESGKKRKRKRKCTRRQGPSRVPTKGKGKQQSRGHHASN